jgi:para-nitrobenzyl esterase
LPQPWTGERDATRFAAAPFQPAEREKVEHSEDCLYLNIWAPQGKGPFPVFVWIHGGGFTAGRASEPIYDGTKFAAEGIVCVSVEYRLGVLGFLDVEPMLGSAYAGSANNGLRDLIAALSWIQEHIADFGGDPDRVTIGGESAGAKLADILMGVPSAKPLFAQVISESGGAERIWPRATAQSVGSGFAATFRSQSGVTDRDLLTVSGSALLQAQKKFLDEWPQHFPLRPEIDGELLRQLPVDTISSGSTKGKRLLIGTNRDESALFVGPHPGHDATPAELGNLSQAAFASVYAHYAQVYPAITDDQRRIRALTAEEYWIPSLRVANAHVKAGGSAWMYRLDFTETVGRMSGYAYHSLDVGLVWDKPHTDIGDDREEALLATTMHSAWLAFLKGGAPAAAKLPAWSSYTPDKRETMILDSQSRVEMKPQEAEYRLWRGLL